jgi:hypothetical protein
METTLGVWPGSWYYIAILELFALLASLAVVLRFWSRRIDEASIHTDDWLVLVTLPLQHGVNATILIAFLKFGMY